MTHNTLQAVQKHGLSAMRCHKTLTSIVESDAKATYHADKDAFKPHN